MSDMYGTESQPPGHNPIGVEHNSCFPSRGSAVPSQPRALGRNPVGIFWSTTPSKHPSRHPTQRRYINPSSFLTSQPPHLQRRYVPWSRNTPPHSQPQRGCALRRNSHRGIPNRKAPTPTGFRPKAQGWPEAQRPTLGKHPTGINHPKPPQPSPNPNGVPPQSPGLA